MEFEQIVKQLGWLDEERRKDKATIAVLEERLASIDANLNVLNEHIKGLDKDVSNLSSLSPRLKQFDDFLAQQRTDMNLLIEDLDKKTKHREQEARKRQQKEFAEIDHALAEIRSTIDSYDIRKNFKEQADEDLRLDQAINELKHNVEDFPHSIEDLQRSDRVLEENRRQQAKRISDIQGDMTALHKRMDDHRGKLEVYSDSIRILDSRINELLASEGDRKQAQNTFLDQQALAQVERDRSWKQWNEEYNTFKKQTGELEAQLLTLGEATLVAKRIQGTFNDINQRMERRINEITEMQRLVEDRLRQEWVTFQGNDQKRWTGYTISHDDSLRDLNKNIEKLDGRMTALDDNIQIITDQLQQTTDTTEQQLQELMNLAHDWLASYERIMGHTRKRG